MQDMETRLRVFFSHKGIKAVPDTYEVPPPYDTMVITHIGGGETRIPVTEWQEFSKKVWGS